MEILYDQKNIESKLHDLTKRLNKYCDRKQIKRLGTFTLMFNEEEGRNIEYVRNITAEEMPGDPAVHDKDSHWYSSSYDSIHWPHTGFISSGGITYLPLLISDLAEWLIESPYLDGIHYKTFFEHFEELLNNY